MPQQPVRGNNLAAQANAVNVIIKDAKVTQGKLISMIAALAQNRLNAAFRVLDFVSRVRNIIPIEITNDVPLGGVPATNTPRQALTNAAGTLYTTANWTHQCPSNRYRVIVATRIDIDASAGGADTGNVELGLGNANQLYNQAQVGITRRAQISVERFPYGGNVKQRQGSVAAGPVAAMAAVESGNLWAELCPFGIESAFRNSKVIDFLQPNEQLQYQFSNLNGVAPKSVQFLAGTLKGVGFDLLLG